MKDFQNLIIDITTDFFIRSNDFNGIPLSHFTSLEEQGLPKTEFYEVLSHLILNKQIVAMFDSHCVNPHILRIPPLEPAKQIELLKTNPYQICLYPTAEQVQSKKDLAEFNDRPFTKKLWLLEPHLTPFYFDLSVLEKYLHDARYSLKFNDYEGNIHVKEKHISQKEIVTKDYIYLQTFGTGYDENKNRVVVVYLRYLSKLSPKHQSYWLNHLCDKHCEINSDYHKATLYGASPINISVYSALLLEQKEINTICNLIGKPSLFRKTFEYERPEGFHLMLSPTKSNFYNFALLFDKIISDNLNKAFFERDIPSFSKKEHKDCTFERKYHGTLNLLENWLSKFYSIPNDPKAISELIRPFKELRKLRQAPAHSIINNEYDFKYAQMQDDLVTNVYDSLHILRVLFSRHPLAITYKTPKWSMDDRVVLY
ncbi:MAG: hypothetical protein GXX85_13035 [Ignavibacteria bacterium]|nr:hypothetical protein [Ignavibacteria bacterium]